MEEIIMSTNNQERSRKGTSGLVFVGCLILGLAIGFFVENVVGGLFVGLGIGFIAMAIARAVTAEW